MQKQAKGEKKTNGKRRRNAPQEQDIHLRPQVEFEPLHLFDITLGASVLKDLSRDQRILYEQLGKEPDRATKSCTVVDPGD